jgi:histidine triad (HIT) family protein
MYDSHNIFARIIRKEIPAKIVYEDEFVLAFHDIQPKAKTHVLIIPKGAYMSAQDFYAQASSQEIEAFARVTAKLAAELSIEKSGYRLISNHGVNGGQEVPHFHMHLLGGNPLGPMINEHIH